jgi:hypothetical protein
MNWIWWRWTLRHPVRRFWVPWKYSRTFPHIGVEQLRRVLYARGHQAVADSLTGLRRGDQVDLELLPSKEHLRYWISGP